MAYSLLDDGTDGGFDSSRFSLLGGTEADPTTGGTVDPSHFSLYPNLDESNALDTNLGDKNAWLRRYARSVAEREVNPDPKQAQPQSEQPARTAATTPTVPPPQHGSAYATSDPTGLARSERSQNQANAIHSIGKSAGKIIKLAASAGAGGAAAGGAGAGAGAGAGGAAAGGAGSAAGAADAAGAGGAAGGIGGGGGAAGLASAGDYGTANEAFGVDNTSFGSNFGSAFKGGYGTGAGGYLGRYARAQTGGIYGSGGEGGVNYSALLGKLGGGMGGGGGGGGSGGGEQSGGPTDVADSGTGGKAGASLAGYLAAIRNRKQQAALMEAEGGGLSGDTGNLYFFG